VDILSPVVTSLTHTLENEDDILFFDPFFTGVLYNIEESSNDSSPKLISFTGMTPTTVSYSIVGHDYEDNFSNVFLNVMGDMESPDIVSKISPGTVVEDLKSKQKKYKLRIAPSEGLHRIFSIINFLFKAKKSGERHFEQIKNLLRRKVKLVLLLPKPGQPVDEFLGASCKSSLRMLDIRKVISPHTFLDN